MVKAKLDAWRIFVLPKSARGKPNHVMKNFLQRKKMPALQKANKTHCNHTEENLRLLLDEKFPATQQPPTADLICLGPAHEISVAAVSAVLKGLNNRKSPGPDQVNHSTLKLLHRFHSQVLTQLFSAYLTVGYFPRS